MPNLFLYRPKVKIFVFSKKYEIGNFYNLDHRYKYLYNIKRLTFVGILSSINFTLPPPSIYFLHRLENSAQFHVVGYSGSRICIGPRQEHWYSARVQSGSDPLPDRALPHAELRVFSSDQSRRWLCSCTQVQRSLVYRAKSKGNKILINFALWRIGLKLHQLSPRRFISR